MRRRRFIKSLLALPIVAILPVSAGNPDYDIRNNPNVIFLEEMQGTRTLTLDQWHPRLDLGETIRGIGNGGRPLFGVVVEANTDEFTVVAWKE